MIKVHYLKSILMLMKNKITSKIRLKKKKNKKRNLLDKCNMEEVEGEGLIIQAINRLRRNK